MHTINQDTGARTYLGFGAVGNFSDLTSDWRKSSFRIWAVNDSGNGLAQINPTTGVGTSIGGFLTADIKAIGFDVITEKMYATDQTSLYTVNPSTGLATFVGVTGRTDVDSLAFDLAGNLYGVGISDGSLLQLNTTTGGASVIGLLGVAAMADLAVRPEDGVMFGTATVGAFSIYRINPSTASMTLVGPYDFAPGINGLAFSPAIPEPASLTLLSITALAATALRRRRH